MEEKIKEAIKLLINNDYAVFKMSSNQTKDAQECEKMIENGEEKDCSECSCIVCLVS